MDLVVSDSPLLQRDHEPARPLVFGLAGLLLGAGAAAGLMFLLDPVSGRHRRAKLRERLGRVVTDGDDVQRAADEAVAPGGGTAQPDRELTPLQAPQPPGHH